MKRFPLISSLGILIILHLSAAVCPVKGDFPDHPLPGIERYISTPRWQGFAQTTISCSKGADAEEKGGA